MAPGVPYQQTEAYRFGNAIDALLDQTRMIEKVVTTLALGELDFEGSDSLDAPNSIKP